MDIKVLNIESTSMSSISFALDHKFLFRSLETDIFYLSFEKKISPTCKLHHGPAGPPSSVNFDILDDETSKR
ncbi:hypothetical protein BpHYR1_051135 [Brachionus plicatilis]|uniref:Uncharacterized protein n=1 Tax=Brachionus plicatilis TaxID=10195 RepID=A0A3M7S168_BRAPC|nr:hypothetical protein BpHYR1_051135 [Brachionus plicatilis]